MKKQFILGAFAIPFAAALLSGCGNKTNNGTRIVLWDAQTKYNPTVVEQIVNDYNHGQGTIDKVDVTLNHKNRDTATTLNLGVLSKKPTKVDIHPLYDQVMIKGIEDDLFENLDPYFQNESLLTKKSNGERVLDLNDFSENSLNRFRLNRETKYTGKGEHLYALAQMSNPAILYYNEDFFKQQGINIVSISEENLQNYNTAHGTSFMPHGYAEYKTAPAEGLTATGSGADVVYRVFNNQIGMSFDELTRVGKLLTKSHTASSPSTYGFLSEYWFPFGWSVGGDCIALNPSTNKYKFTLADKLSNYLVIEDNVTVGVDTYNKGDIVNYRSKLFLNEHKDDEVFSKLYELPSQYDAFAYFCSLTTDTDKKVDANINGIKISPCTKDVDGSGSKINYFTSGKTAMVIEGFDQVNLTAESGKNFNVAKMVQYREYVGGEVASDGSFKVIGKEYDGSLYTGELKTTDTGVKVVGKSTSSALSIGWGIPKNSEHKEAAFKFLQYWCSKEVQLKLASVNDGIPTIPSVSVSSEYNSITKPFKNSEVLNSYEINSQIGDWSYLGDKDWVNNWSEDLNSRVRNGEMNLTDFVNKHSSDIDNILAGYAYKIHGKE